MVDHDVRETRPFRNTGPLDKVGVDARFNDVHYQLRDCVNRLAEACIFASNGEDLALVGELFSLASEAATKAETVAWEVHVSHGAH